MNRKRSIIISVTGIFIVLLVLVGLTYGYYLTNIRGNTNTKSIEVSTANLILEYGENTNVIQGINNAVPGYSVTKYFTATNNGNASVDYVATLDSVVNELTRQGDLEYTLTCASYLKTGFSLAANGTPTGTIDGTCNGTEATQFPSTTTTSAMVGNRISTTQVHYYVLTINYKEMGVDQSDDMNKTFSALVNIKDIKTIPNPYQSNTSLLSYNIINNALTGTNGEVGSKFVAAPLTKVAVEISGSWATGKYGNVKLTAAQIPFGFDPWLYADTEAGASSGTSAYGASCSTLVGKHIYDQSSTIHGNFQVVDCDGEIPIIKTEIFNQEKVLSVTPDDYGISYYFRGNVEDNYLNFAGKCWRIVRIEGDGSIEIILADGAATCSVATKDKTGSAFIDTGNYGYTDDYVTNSSGQISASSNYIADYKTGVTNNGNSIKYHLNSWLTTSGMDQTKIKEKTWCLGNINNSYSVSSPYSLLGNSKNDLMYGRISFYYKTAKRLYGRGEVPNAILKCEGETFTSFIGTLTADEIVFAGAKAGMINENYYLRDNASDRKWWTLSLSWFEQIYDNAFIVDTSGILNENDSVNDSSVGLRSVVSLKAETEISDGVGTLEDPYVLR